MRYFETGKLWSDKWFLEFKEDLTIIQTLTSRSFCSKGVLQRLSGSLSNT